MDVYPHRTMFEVEDRLWWYRGLREYIGQALDRARLPGDAAVLDAGCGTGANLMLLSQSFPRAVGCDLAADAVTLCRGRGLEQVVVSDVNHLPFPTAAFDCVVCTDVLESYEVDERRAVAELARVTRPGGRIIVTVCALEFLLSEHDRAFHTTRRFSKRRARSVLSGAGLEVLAVRYLFGSFLLPIVAYRLVKRWWRDPRHVAEARSDLFLPPWPINDAMFAVVKLESLLARIAHLPFGSTLLVEVKRT